MENIPEWGLRLLAFHCLNRGSRKSDQPGKSAGRIDRHGPVGSIHHRLFFHQPDRPRLRHCRFGTKKLQAHIIHLGDHHQWCGFNRDWILDSHRYHGKISKKVNGWHSFIEKPPFHSPGALFKVPINKVKRRRGKNIMPVLIAFLLLIFSSVLGELEIPKG